MRRVCRSGLCGRRIATCALAPRNRGPSGWTGGRCSVPGASVRRRPVRRRCACVPRGRGRGGRGCWASLCWWWQASTRSTRSDLYLWMLAQRAAPEQTPVRPICSPAPRAVPSTPPLRLASLLRRRARRARSRSWSSPPITASCCAARASMTLPAPWMTRRGKPSSPDRSTTGMCSASGRASR